MNGESAFHGSSLAAGLGFGCGLGCTIFFGGASPPIGAPVETAATAGVDTGGGGSFVTAAGTTAEPLGESFVDGTAIESFVDGAAATGAGVTGTVTGVGVGAAIAAGCAVVSSTPDPFNAIAMPPAAAP